MEQTEDYYLADETWDRLIDTLAGPLDPDRQGWTRRDDVILALADAGICPARIKAVTD